MAFLGRFWADWSPGYDASEALAHAKRSLRKADVLAGLIYVRSRPTWIRYSDFNQDPPLIVEFDF